MRMTSSGIIEDAIEPEMEPMASDVSLTDLSEPFDPIKAKAELIIHRSKFNWKPSFAFV